MISKELLENVLYGESIDNISVITNTVTFEYSHYVNGIFQYRRKTDINIYELAHKCKEWAFENNYSISSEKISESNDSFKHKWYSGVNKNWWFHGVTEPEAIFKACQWIIDNVKTNSIS